MKSKLFLLNLVMLVALFSSNNILHAQVVDPDNLIKSLGKKIDPDTLSGNQFVNIDLDALIKSSGYPKYIKVISGKVLYRSDDKGYKYPCLNSYTGLHLSSDNEIISEFTFVDIAKLKIGERYFLFLNETDFIDINMPKKLGACLVLAQGDNASSYKVDYFGSGFGDSSFEVSESIGEKHIKLNNNYYDIANKLKNTHLEISYIKNESVIVNESYRLARVVDFLDYVKKVIKGVKDNEKSKPALG